MAVYRAYGLTVRSTVPLPGLERVMPRSSVDVDLRWGATHTVPATPPPGRVLLQCDDGDRIWYAASVDRGRHVLRFPGLCDFALHEYGTETVAQVDPAVAPDLAAILASGALLAFVLALRDATVLHASAVQTPHGIVAVTGRSGDGKSTVAALACAGGLPLVTDDLLRVDLPADGAPAAFAGARELRLRPAVAGIAAHMTASGSRRTVDGRLAVRPVVADRPHLPIAALVLPQPRRDRRRVAVRPVPAGIAMMRLLAAPRLVGWRWARALRSQFRDIGTLVDRVPVVQIEVPWGPEFDADLAHSIAEALCSIDSPAPVGERGTAVGRSA